MQTDLEDLADILQRLERAENAGDADYIVSMMADDVVIMVPSEPVQEGREACETFLRGMLGWMMESLNRHIKYVSAEVRVIGDYAFDRGTFSFTATPKGTDDTAHAQGKYFWLYSRNAGGRWKMARLIVSLDDPPEEEER